MKTLRHLLLILMSSLLFMSCWEHQTDEDPDTEEEIDEPKIIIPVQEAEDLFHRYGEERVPLIEEFTNVDENGEPIPMDDDRYIRATRSFSIDYETLQTYLKFIEQQADKSKTDITGLRIYLAKYPQTRDDGRGTIFMNPLMKAGDSGIKDDISFAIEQKGDKYVAIPVADAFTVPKRMNSKQANLRMIVVDGVQSLAGNHTIPRPPPPKEGESDGDFQ